ncbi:hypothetical protein L1887_01479 [Cichorium endivia]|nr:hypothetical protein L1887_01479 [Cichorium endivia]
MSMMFPLTSKWELFESGVVQIPWSVVISPCTDSVQRWGPRVSDEVGGCCMKSASTSDVDLLVWSNLECRLLVDGFSVTLITLGLLIRDRVPGLARFENRGCSGKIEAEDEMRFPTDFPPIHVVCSLGYREFFDGEMLSSALQDYLRSGLGSGDGIIRD